MKTHIHDPYRDESKPVGQRVCLGCRHTDKWCYGNLTLKFCNRWVEGTELPEGWLDTGKQDTNCAQILRWAGEGMPPADEQNCMAPTVNDPSGLFSGPAAAGFWERESRTYQKQLTTERAALLAADLSLPIEALQCLPIGFDQYANCYTFPEWADGQICGIGTRTTQAVRAAHHARYGYWLDSKKMVSNSNRGLTLPIGWEAKLGTLMVSEGPSDVLSGCWAGRNVIGRYSNAGGAELIAKVCGDRQVVICGENDQHVNDKGVEEWPGGRAKNVAEQVSRLIGRPVGWWFPPPQFKDLRDMILNREKVKNESGS